MKRLVNVQGQYNYIQDCYGRLRGENVDIVTINTCFDILNWMSKKDEFNNVVYAAYEEQKGQNYQKILGEEGRMALVEEINKDKSVKRRKTTLDRCLKCLLKDMYVEE